MKRRLSLSLVSVAAVLASVAGVCAPAGAAANTATQNSRQNTRNTLQNTAQAAVTTTPIQHLVFLMQENHTFDNYFGTRPGVDGIPAGTCMPRTRTSGTKNCVKPSHIGERGSLDLDHTQRAFETQYDGGRMDGFIEAVSTEGKDGTLAMAYYDDRDLPYYWNLADDYVLFDRFFSSARGGSVRNHMYRVSGSPGATGKSESIPANGWGNIPTIFDRLQERGISWKFYVENYDRTITYRTRHNVKDADRGAQVVWVPLLAYDRFLDNPELNKHIVDMDQYYEDAANGTLPAVSFMAPSGNSEHPPGNIAAGQTLVRTLVTELMRSPNWSSSMFLWSYDDWGGWYDHVVPPQVDSYGYGFRVPAMLVSPYAKRGYVDSTTLDFTSVLKFVEANWRLAPLAERDRRANNFLDAFDFSAGPRAPVLLGTDRHPKAPVVLAARPVYAGYAGAVGLVALMLALALLTGRGRRVRRAPAAAESRIP